MLKVETVDDIVDRTIPTATMRALMEWDWPGNVRELESFIEGAVVLTRGGSLEVPLVTTQSALTTQESRRRLKTGMILRES